MAASEGEAENNLLSIPPELFHHILIFCQPRDLSSFSKVCRKFFALVYRTDDQHVWRELFLTFYDDPRKSARTLVVGEGCSSAESFNWKDELQRRTEAELVARQAHVEPQEMVPERRRALETFVSTLQQALPASPKVEETSLNLLWLDRVLRETHMLNPSPLQTEIQLHSHLRSHISLTHDLDDDNEETETAISERRIISRCFVYDIRNYKPGNDWGPFLNDGSVNWQHIEHLANVVLINLRELPPLWATTIPPLGLENVRAFSAPGPYCDSDWAGVEGTWRRYVCFMDYRDLFAFNYSNVASGPRNPLFFRDSRFREATRLIEVKLHVVQKDELRFHKPSCEGPDYNPRYPVLFFSGTSRGVSGNEAKIEGNVRIGVDGTPRWTFYDLIQGAVHNGSTLWCSQGVQIGGLASATGIVGSWSTSMHDQGDPVGPFWLWKVPHTHHGALMDFT